MRNLITLTFILLSVSVVSGLFAQSEEQGKKSSLEVITQMYGRSGPIDMDIRSSSIFFARRAGGVFYSQNLNPEIQVRYAREVIEDVSIYGGLAYGINFFNSVYYIRRVSTTSTASTTTFVSSSATEYRGNRHQIGYGSAHLGARYTLHIKRNDAFNFSLGGKGIYYPTKDLSVVESGFSKERKADFTFEFENEEIPSDKIIGGLEMDVNFQLGFENSPLKIMLGVTVDRAIETVRVLNSQITIEGEVTEFRHKFGGGRVGAYLGLSYSLGNTSN